MKPRLAAAVALIGVLSTPTIALAGAWTLEEGRIWSKAALLYLRSDTVFADQNDERFGLTGCKGPALATCLLDGVDPDAVEREAHMVEP